jgi:glycosyltransferase 2 family protein
MSSTAIGYMLNNLIPRSGEVARPYLLGKHEGISKAAAFGTIIIERIIDTLSFLLMFGLALIYFKNRISSAIPDIDTAVIILTIFIFLLFFWVIFTMFRTEQSLKLIRFFTRVFPLKYRNKIDQIFSSLVNGFHSLRKPKLLLMIGFYSAVLWIVYLVSAYIPFYAFDIFTGQGSNTSLLEGLWNANILLVLINVSQFIPAPAATGPYHYIVKVSLVSIFAISEGKALGYATSTHLMNFIIYTIVGIYYFVVSNYKISELKEETI